MRGCWIGLRIGDAIGLDAPTRQELVCAMLLQDLGCGPSASRVRETFLSVASVPAPTRSGAATGLPARARPDASHPASRPSRAPRGGRGHLWATPTAPRLPDPATVRDAIAAMSARWDGAGAPAGLSGEQIPVIARIAVLARALADAFAQGGPAGALATVKQGAGAAFDPGLASTAHGLGAQPELWAELRAPDLGERLLAHAPTARVVAPTDRQLDDIAAAFGELIDSRSPYTAGHTARVASFTDHLAGEMGLAPDRRRWLRRAALLHDLGKIGVPRHILDKPGPLTDAEMDTVRLHARKTEDILSQIGIFSEMARVAGAHHERLDGRGYPRRLTSSDITLETRILTVADVFDALTAERPYRGAMPTSRALSIIGRDIGAAFDPVVFAALQSILSRRTIAGLLAA